MDRFSKAILRLDRKLFRKAPGYSFLEQIVLLPLLLATIFAAIDLNTVLQANSALTAGLKTALRCAYPVDGKCLDTSAAPPARLYNWYGGNPDISYSYLLKDYDAELSWLSYPVFTATNIQARILGDVRYSAESFRYEAQNDYFLMQARFPYLAGTESRNPRFVYQQQPTVNYPRAQILNQSPANISAARISATAGRTDTATIRFRFSIPDFNQASNCFQVENGFNTSHGSGQPNTTSPCDTDLRAPVILHLLGSKSVSPDTSGQIELRIDGRAFGGQEIVADVNSQSGPANFVPRGAIKDSNFVASEILSDGSELARYGHSIIPNSPSPGSQLKLSIDQEHEVEISVTNVQGPGTLSWIPSALHIYSADYRAAPSGPTNLGCSASSAQALANPAYNPIYMSLPVVAESCGIVSQSSACEPNLGVSTPADSDGLVRGSAEANSICPAPAGASQVAWSERLVDTGRSISWKVETCNAPAPSVPSELSGYRKLLWPPQPNHALTTYEAVQNYDYTEERTPEWALSNDLSYSACGVHRIERVCFDEDNRACAGASSEVALLEGHAVVDLAECAPSRIGEQLKSYPELNTFPQKYYARFPERITGSITSDSPPADAHCTPHKKQYKPGELRLLTDAPLKESEPAPQACTGPGALVCRQEFVGFEPGSGDNSPDFMPQEATRMGLNEIRAALPAATTSCPGPYCTQIEVEPRTDGSNLNFEARASIDIPLNLLFGKTMRFSSVSRDQDASETNFN